MPVSNDVSLPRATEARFPDRCVGCGATDPGETYEARTGTLGWWTFLLVTRKRFNVMVPACGDCCAAMERRNGRARFYMFLLMLPGLALAYYLFGDLTWVARKYAVIGVVVVFLIPIIAWQVFRPPPVDLTAWKDTVDYEFRDPEYAREFAALNGVTLDDS